MITKNYPCKQAELYVIVRIILLNLLARIGAFNNFKPFYNAAFVNTKRLQLNAAKDMPDEAVRNARVTSKRIELEAAAKTARERWQDLKRYIHDAFAEDQWTAKENEAGAQYYDSAANDNWEDVELLMEDGSAFITTYTAELLANNNMPAGFPALFGTAETTLGQKLEQFLLLEETARTGGDDKVKANNKVYDDIISVCLDGQRIYVNDDTLKALFVFDTVLGLVSNKIADLKGSVTTGIASDSVSEVKVEVLELGESVVTDDTGKYDFGALLHGTYTVVFSKAGFVTQTFNDVVIEAGVTKKIDVVLLGV